jgi:hypothetical protein
MVPNAAGARGEMANTEKYVGVVQKGSARQVGRWCPDPPSHECLRPVRVALKSWRMIAVLW